MPTDIRVYTPVRTIAEVDGVSLVLLTVEILGDRTCLRFCCPPNERTRELDAEYERHMAAVGGYLSSLARTDAPSQVRPQDRDDPMTEIFHASVVALDDGCGTTFIQRSGSSGGTGTEWLMEWMFGQVPAPEARELTVAVTPPGRPTACVRVPLADQRGTEPGQAPAVAATQPEADWHTDIQVPTPVATIAEVDGVSLVLLTVVLMDDHTDVRFCCPPNERTRELDAEYRRRMNEYARRHLSGSAARASNVDMGGAGEVIATWSSDAPQPEPTEDPIPPPPDSYLETMFGHDITLDDGCGTAFRCWGGGGASVKDWLVGWMFRPRPAPEARELTVSITPPGRPISSVRVPLDY
jgi:hypothetical protein